jgi:tetratricopeptide (TPR) repeat protein
MAVDPVTGAVLGWLVGQAGTAGKAGLGKLILGDKQQNALRQIVREAVETATKDLADGVVLRAALLVDSPEAKQTEVVEVLDLTPALAGQVRPIVKLLAEQGYVFEADPLIDVLARQVLARIQGDAARGGPLAPLAEVLRGERQALASEQAVAELRGISGGIDRLSRAAFADAAADRELDGGGGVPGEVEHFTGRQGPLEDLRRRVDAHDPAGSVAAVYVVDGMPGLGKTAFVIHAAHHLAGRYPDGAIFVDLLGFSGLASLSVSQGLDELLAQAGVPRAQIPGEEGPKQALWRRLMRGRRALIVLDNARNAGQVEPLLPNSPRCLVLITARSKLYDLDATPLPLPVLTADEARSLFMAVAGADRCRDEEALAQIVAGCHWLPLAIRLMASRVRHGDPIADVADDVTALAEEKKIRGVFDLSYNGLDADLQRAVRLLGVYPGIDITGPVMAALADTSAARGRRMLRGLATHNLIDRLAGQTGARSTDTRYQPHDLIRDYTRSRAAAEPPALRQAVLDRLGAHYLTMVQAVEQLHDRPAAPLPNATRSVFQDLAHANAWLITERTNLLASLDNSPANSVELATTAGRLFSWLCCAPEAARCYQLSFTHHSEAGNRAGEASALRGLAHVDRMLGRYEISQQRFQQAHAISREIGGRYGEAEALWGLAEVDRMLGRYEISQQRFQQAHAIYQEIGDRSGEASALWGLADVDRSLGRYETAQQRYQQAHAIYQEIGDRTDEAAALLGLAHVDRKLGRYENSQQRYQQAHAIYQEIGDRTDEAYALWGLADVDLMLGRYEISQQRFQQAHAIYQEIGDRSGEASALRGLADVDLMLGRYETSQQRYQQAHAIWQEIGVRYGEATALWGLGLLAEAMMDTKSAAERWREALQIFDALQLPFAEAVRDALAALD